MTFPEALEYLESFIDYEHLDNFPYKESFKLNRIQILLNILNNPHKELKCIHIAGTKGKGSTAAFVAYILREAGFKTALYTSPHLYNFRERIRILQPRGNENLEELEFEGMISEEDLSTYTEKLGSYIGRYNESGEFDSLTFFEVYTALALLYFKEKKVDFAVLETGLGGRLDATSVVDPLVCGITQISLEHTHLLGSILKDIAFEKSGIIKQKGQIVVSSPQEKEADEVIQKRCDEYQAKLYRVNRDFHFKEGTLNQKQQVFDIEGLYKDLRINLLGAHQLINATTAVGIIEVLRNLNINVSEDKIRRGLEVTRWPGRFEIISETPYIVLDGAQNIASVNALVDILRKTFDSKKTILVLGISKDKDIEGMCRILSDITDEIILTKAGSPRAVDLNILRNFIKEDKIMRVTTNVAEAIHLARCSAAKDDVILVTGSLFVVGEARKICLN